MYIRNYRVYHHSLTVDMGEYVGDMRRVEKNLFSCSATVSSMCEMLTLIKSWHFFCHKLQMGCWVFVFTCNVCKKKKKRKHVSASKDDFKVKHKEKYCPYHLWTNFIIMSLEDERGRGELNVRGDKGIKNTFSTRQSANHSKNMIYILNASTYTILSSEYHVLCA